MAVGRFIKYHIHWRQCPHYLSHSVQLAVSLLPPFSDQDFGPQTVKWSECRGWRLLLENECSVMPV